MGYLYLFKEIFFSAISGEFEGLISIALFACGIAALVSLIKQFRMDSWPCVAGELLPLDIKLPGGEQWHIVESATQHSPVNFHYKINNYDYTGTQVSPWSFLSFMQAEFTFDELSSQCLADRRQQVDVYYSPKHPERAYLKRGGLVMKVYTAIFMFICFWAPVPLFLF
ncbi:MAG: hypothetical protein V3W04_12315 [Gammaproteobacteria bacterium]